MADQLGTFTPSFDLIPIVRRQLVFLKQVDEHPNLYDGNLVSEAIYRYERYWLPLVAKKPNKKLLPPLDIRWIWHVHMLSPYAYNQDCLNVCGKSLNNEVCSTGREERDAKNAAKKKWQSMHRHVDFDLDLDEDWSVKQPKFLQNSRIKYDLRSACKRQSSFYYQVSLPHYKDPKFLNDALVRYGMFLTLKKLNLDLFIVPTYDIDLMWHTHQTSPLAYNQDTSRYLGNPLNHDDTDANRTPGSKLDTSYNLTKDLWLQTFKQHHGMCGCMYRGEPPLLQIAEDTRNQAITANIFHVTVMSLQAENISHERSNISIYRQTRDGNIRPTQLALRKTIPISNSQHRSGIKTFKFDTNKFSGFHLKAEQKIGGCCSEQKELLGYHTFPYHASSSNNYTLPLMIQNGQQIIPTGGQVKLSVNAELYKKGPLLLHVQPTSFTYVPESAQPSPWGPVPLPMNATGGNPNAPQELLVGNQR